MAFSAVTTGANTNALTVGAGGTLTPSGGTITANNLSAGTYGISITGNAATATTATTAATSATVPFSGVTAATNTTALLVGSGGTLGPTGTGTITATRLAGPFGIPLAAVVATTETRTAATYGDTATVGPAVTVTTGTTALVTITARMTQGTNGESCFVGIDVSGATTAAAADTRALSFSGQSNGQRVLQASATYLITVTPGSNTFTAKYKSSSSTCTFGDRNIIVTPY